MTEIPESVAVEQAIPLLKNLGYELHLDWDGELIIEAPPEISVSKITALLRAYQTRIAYTVQWHADLEKRYLSTENNP